MRFILSFSVPRPTVGVPRPTVGVLVFKNFSCKSRIRGGGGERLPKCCLEFNKASTVRLFVEQVHGVYHGHFPLEEYFPGSLLQKNVFF